MGSLTEGIGAGLGISQAIAQRKQFQFEREQIQRANRIKEEENRAAQEQKEFEVAVDFINSGIWDNSEAGLKAFTQAQHKVFQRVGGRHLDGITYDQILQHNKRNKNAQKDFQNLMAKASKALKDKDTEAAGELLEKLAEIVGATYSSARSKGQLEAAEFQREQFDELREKSGGDAGRGSLLNDPNVSQLELSIRINYLSQQVADGDASPEEIKELNVLKATQEDISSNIPGAKTASRLQAADETKLDFVIPSDKRGRTLNPKTFEAVPPGTTNRQARDMGAVLATPSQVKEFAELSKVRGIVDIVGGLALKAIKATNAAAALAQGGKLKAGAISRANSVAAAYEAERSAFIGVLSRSLAAERGVLTEGDIERIKTAFPNMRDTKEIAEFKMGFINFMISNAEFAVKQQVFGLLNDDQYKAGKEKLFSILEAFREPGSGTQSPPISLPPEITGQGGSEEDFSTASDAELIRMMNE